MNCPQCGAPVEVGAKNCKYCGESIAQAQNNMPPQMNQPPMNPMQMQGQTMFCPNCGKEMKAEDKFCGNCGYSPQNIVANSGEIRQKEKILAAIAHLALILGVIPVCLTGGAISLLFLTLLSFLFAPLTYFIGRKTMFFASKHALQACLWQVALYTILVLVSCCARYAANSLDRMLGLDFMSAMWYFMLVTFVAAIFMIYAAYKALKGREYKYPFMPRYDKDKWIFFAVCLFICVGGLVYCNS